MKIVPFSRFVVADRSMIPQFNLGDHVLTLNWTPIAVGDVVVFTDEGKKLIKRVADYKDKLFLIKGDNVAESTVVYEVDRSKILGKVIYTY